MNKVLCHYAKKSLSFGDLILKENHSRNFLIGNIASQLSKVILGGLILEDNYFKKLLNFKDKN